MALELLNSCGMILRSEKQDAFGAQAPVSRAATYSGLNRFESFSSVLLKTESTCLFTKVKAV